MTTYKKIDWPDINGNVYRVLNFLGQTHKNDINAFLNWFETIDQKNVVVADPNNAMFKNWIIAGIPQMKKITNDMNIEIKKIDDMITQVLLSRSPLSEKVKLNHTYYDAIKTVLESVIEFLGCRNKFGEWYVNFIKLFPSVPAVKNNINYFEMECLTDRNRLLRK